MYKFRYAVALLIPFLLVACGGNTPESFGETVFSHLKSNNDEELLDLTANKDDYFALIAERNKTSEEQVNPTPADVERLTRKNQRKVKKGINDIIAYGKMNGGWDDALLVDVEVKQSEKSPSEADVYLRVQISDKHYRVLFDDLAKSERGWVMTDNPRWIGLVYDPQYDTLIGKELTINANGGFLSCKTAKDLGYAQIMAKADPEAVMKMIDDKRCMLVKMESGMTATIEELGDYHSDNVNDPSRYPFSYVKVKFEHDGQQYSQWILSDRVKSIQ
ncbi:hypothetical protein [Kangiella sediminilitoris]|uniref:Lipoprotein n=1 Tax=Kangiella sediminilitoris TaxID=1144748 RepID=A0A1B3BCJ7_9GAMM|nr:hypothetical protein [Kangiella sediminilitoris]AOE50536.1 hypothetical protein KS2013_1827 [Kangiella sediminilitoris]